MKFTHSLLVIGVCFLFSCSHVDNKVNDSLHRQFVQHSEFVKDTFFISLQLPTEYDRNPDKRYPTLIFLDGNFYFPIMSALIREYEVAGLIEPSIVIGVGYKSFKAMDSLRVRDYLFPKALPSDELAAPGGGQNFYNYLTAELLPEIDSKVRTDPRHRTLLGHSFGGYFVLYTLTHELVTRKSQFQNFVSASPTLWYNDFYLNMLPDQLANNENALSLFLTVGAVEDSMWSVNPVKKMARKLEETQSKNLQLRSRVFSHLDHMDVPVVTFAQGLRELSD